MRLKAWFAADEDRAIRLGICLFIAVCAALLTLT